MLPIPLLLLLADRLRTWLTRGGEWSWLRPHSATPQPHADKRDPAALCDVVKETGQRPRGNVDGRWLSAPRRHQTISHRYIVVGHWQKHCKGNLTDVTRESTTTTTTTTTILRPFFRDHPGEPVPEENIWTLRCKGRLTEADTLTIRLGTTPSELTSAYLHHAPSRVHKYATNIHCKLHASNEDLWRPLSKLLWSLHTEIVLT